MSQEPPGDADPATDEDPVPVLDPSEPVESDEAGGDGEPTASDRSIAVPEETDAEQPFEGAFLGSVRERLSGRRDRGGDIAIESVDDADRDGALSRLAEALPDGAFDDLEAGWETLESDVGLRRTTTSRSTDRDRPRRIQRHQAATSLRDNFQAHVLALHGFATFLLFGLGMGIVISAWTQFVPPEFWILSLPLMLLALAGLLPLAGWVVGFWNPQQV